MGKGPVTQAWTHELTWMQQGVLLTCVRGPDGYTKEGPVKLLQRWLRRCIIVGAFEGGKTFTDPVEPGGGSFTGPSLVNNAGLAAKTYWQSSNWEMGMDQIVDLVIYETDELMHHFTSHLRHAAEILGYKHPDPRIRSWWQKTYLRLVDDLHLMPESEERMDRRLGDKKDDWIALGDRASCGRTCDG